MMTVRESIIADCKNLGQECKSLKIHIGLVTQRSELHEISHEVINRRRLLMRHDTHKQLEALAIAEREAENLINDNILDW